MLQDQAFLDTAVWTSARIFAPRPQSTGSHPQSRHVYVQINLSSLPKHIYNILPYDSNLILLVGSVVELGHDCCDVAVDVTIEIR